VLLEEIKMKTEDPSMDVMIADALLRLKVLENLLINKQVFSKEEYQQELNTVIAQVAKTILSKANVPGGIDYLINLLKENKSSHN